MKKILTIVVSVIMAISMTACGGNTDTTTQSSSEKVQILKAVVWKLQTKV